MKATIALAILGATLTSAQVTFVDGSFVCATPNARFCGGTGTNIIVRCSGTQGQPGNCNDNLAGVPPVGVKSFAPCYESSPTEGDASCSYGGIVYPDDGSDPFPVPATGSSTSSAVDSSSTPYGSATTVVSQYTTGTLTNTYTVTIPRPNATEASATPSAEQSASSPTPEAPGYPPATTEVPSEPATSETPSDTSEAPTDAQSPATSEEPAPSTPTDTPPSESQATLTSVVTVQPTLATSNAPVGEPPTPTTSDPVQYTGAATKKGNVLAGAAAMAVVAAIMG